MSFRLLSSRAQSCRTVRRAAVSAAIASIAMTASLSLLAPLFAPSLVPVLEAQGNGQAAQQSATCKDGTTFTGSSRKGACSGHGGVKSWGDASSAPRPKGATAQCKDGSWTTTTERRGACAGHGGVKSWVKG